MRKIFISAAIALPLSLVTVPASALPAAGHGAVVGESLPSDLVLVKKGFRGGGRGWGWGRMHAFKPPGWNRGRKLGWRGIACPPGHRKKGLCL